MATLTQEDLDNIAARLGAGGSASRIFETLEQLSKLDLADFYKELGKFTDAIKRSTPVQKNFEDLINGNKRALDSNNEGLDELDKVIAKNQEAYKNEADAVKRVELMRQQQNLVTARSQTAMLVAATHARIGLTNFGVSLLGLIETQIKQSYELMATLQTSLDGVAISSKVLIQQNEQSKQTMGAFLDGISAITTIIGVFIKNPVIRALMVGATLATQGLKVLSNKAHELTEKQLESLQREATNTVNTFNTITSTGAILSGGMTQMRNMSLEAGVSVTAFGNIIKRASGEMSMMGMGMGEATRRIAGVSGQLQKSDLGLQLRALGYGIEEQGELTASMFANLNAAGDRRRYSDQEVARMTVQYGKDLKILGDITGQDAKKAMEKARMQAMEADLLARAMQQGGPEAVEKLQRQLAVLPEGLKKGYMEYVSSGGQAITDVATNVAMQTNSQLGPVMRKMYDDLSNTSVNASRAAENVSKGMEAVGAEARNNPATMEAMRSIGMAARLSGDTTLQAITTVGNGLIMAGTIFAKGVTDKAKEAADKTTDPKTRDTLTTNLSELQRSVEITQSIVSNKLNVALENHTTALIKAAKDIDKMLKTYGFGAGEIDAKGPLIGQKEKSTVATLGTGATAVAGGVAGAMIGKAASVAIGKAIGLGIGSIAGSVVPVAGTLLGGAVGGIIGEKIGSFIFEKFGTKDEVKPRALGGPVSRDNVYIVGERGPELFRPDTSGSITPHEKTATMSSDLAKTLNSLSEQTRTTSQSLSVMNKNLTMPANTDPQQTNAYVEKIFDEYSKPVLEVVKKIQPPSIEQQTRPSDDELKKLVQSYFKLEAQLSNLDFLREPTGRATYEDIDPQLKKSQDNMRILFDNLHSKLEGFGVDITRLGKDLTEAERKGTDKQFDMNRYFNEMALPRFADGGIARFPKTGSPALLHGEEAVIPLKDGKVPVSLGKLDVTPQAINIEAQPITFDQAAFGTLLSQPIEQMIRVMPEELRKGFVEFIQESQRSNNTVLELYRKTFAGMIESNKSTSKGIMDSIQNQKNMDPLGSGLFEGMSSGLDRIVLGNKDIIESNKSTSKGIMDSIRNQKNMDPLGSGLFEGMSSGLDRIVLGNKDIIESNKSTSKGIMDSIRNQKNMNPLGSGLLEGMNSNFEKIVLANKDISVLENLSGEIIKSRSQSQNSNEKIYEAGKISTKGILDLVQIQRNIDPLGSGLIEKLSQPLEKVIDTNRGIAETGKITGKNFTDLLSEQIDTNNYTKLLYDQHSYEPLILALEDIKSKIFDKDKNNEESKQEKETTVNKLDPSTLQFQTDLKTLMQEQVFLNRQTVMMSGELKQVMEDIKKINDRMLASQPRQ